jgi:RNA polymerase sigma-70 factor (ECF subfamily)
MGATRDRLCDELLVLRCQEGSAEALDALVLRWHGRLLRYARLRVSADEAAADITQNAWIAVVQNIHRLSDPSAFPSWAYRIVTNKCNDWLRRRRAERGVFDESCPPHLEAVSNGSPNESGTVELLEHALATLGADDRTLVTLYYFDELAVSQIGEIFGIPAGTVKSRLHRCRALLRRQLEESPHE